MNRTFLLLGAFALLPAAASAQADAQATIDIDATVSPAVTLLGEADLALGSFSPFDGVTVAPSDAGAGKIELYYNSAVLVTVPDTGALTGPNNAQLAIAFSCGEAAAAGQVTSFSGTCAAGYDAQLDDLGASQKHYIYVGGAITSTDAEAAGAGAYSGTVTVEASFND